MPSQAFFRPSFPFNMKTESHGEILAVSAFEEITAASAPAFRSAILEALLPSHMRIDLDLARTRFVDSSGLGALISVHKFMAQRSGSIRILNPQPSIVQLLELTRLHRVFEIVPGRS